MSSEMLSQQVEEVAAVLKQLAHPVRLKILCGLLDGEKNVNQLVEYCGATQSWVSQALARMKLEGLVDSRKEANFAFYKVADARLIPILKVLQKTYCNVKESKK